MANAPVGRVLLISKGSYSASATYKMLDWVRHDGKAWVCKQESIGNVPQDGSYWQLLAQDGAEGGYCYIRYSANADGTGFVAIPTVATKYIGFYTGDSDVAPTDKADYTWSKYAGIDGTSPIAGVEHTATGVKITITDKDGTTTADIANGTDGTSASASVSKIGKVATITCQTGYEEPTEVEITDGNDGSDGVSMRLVGEWGSGNAYVNDGVQIDIVSKSGNSYGCLQSHTASSANQPPNAAYWQLLAQRGNDGSGTGDMNKSTYDTDNDGVVDMAETLNGLTSTIDELNYTDGVTGNVQEQLNGKAPTEHDHTVSDITDFPSSMPASDVPSWAKQEDKPTYTASEVGAGDMLKSTYDTNNNGKVDDSDKLGGQLPSYYQQSTNGLTEETAIADADTMSFYDASENENRKSTWANIVSKLKEHFDEYYNKYVLPKATTSTLGGIKPDGTTITVNEDGVASSAGASGTILDSGTAIKNNTTANQYAGALGTKDLFNELNSNLGDVSLLANDNYPNIVSMLQKWIADGCLSGIESIQIYKDGVFETGYQIDGNVQCVYTLNADNIYVGGNATSKAGCAYIAADFTDFKKLKIKCTRYNGNVGYCTTIPNATTMYTQSTASAEVTAPTEYEFDISALSGINYICIGGSKSSSGTVYYSNTSEILLLE